MERETRLNDLHQNQNELHSQDYCEMTCYNFNMARLLRFMVRKECMSPEAYSCYDGVCPRGYGDANNP